MASFYPSEIDQISSRVSWDRVVENKLFPCSDSTVLRQSNPIHREGPSRAFTGENVVCYLCIFSGG